MTTDLDALLALSRTVPLTGTDIEELRNAIPTLIERVREAEAESLTLRQAMWQGWADLGFDTDGDSGPGAYIAAMGLDGWIQSWLRDIRQSEKDWQDGEDELLERLDLLRVEKVAAEARVKELEALGTTLAEIDASCQTKLAHRLAALEAGIRALAEKCDGGGSWVAPGMAHRLRALLTKGGE